MTRMLIGAGGFVGSTLQRQARFDLLYGRSNIASVGESRAEVAVCAAAPAQKWIANRDPEADRRGIEALMSSLDAVRCGTFILVSTVDVFASPVGVYEETKVEESGLQPYGLHRRLLEKFVEQRFPEHLVVRLPGLVGPGLRKNVIFDLHNDNGLHDVDGRAVFQFYPMVNLWFDLQTAVAAGLRCVHLAAEPLSVADVAATAFNRRFDHVRDAAAVRYDMRSRHAGLFGGVGDYQYSRRESLQAIRAYAQSEPRR
jgi:nucleoside-diphosphate-sugar epimerase